MTKDNIIPGPWLRPAMDKVGKEFLRQISPVQPGWLARRLRANRQFIIFLIRLALFVFVAACFTACAEIKSMPQGGGVYELHYTEAPLPGGDGPSWVKVANDQLTRTALTQCPGGYAKLAEQINPGDLNTTIWQVRCR